ncbi:MAG: hypothetical protein ACOCTI_04285 [Phycisphaeraceae bacterium]
MSPMTRTTIVFGVLLCLLGAGYYLATGLESFTALIPAGIGVLLLICGAFAMAGETARKWAMHVAVIVGVLGVILPLGRLPSVLTAEQINWAVASELLIMLVLSVVYVALAVRSFAEARRARRTGTADQPAPDREANPR